MTERAFASLAILLILSLGYIAITKLEKMEYEAYFVTAK